MLTIRWLISYAINTPDLTVKFLTKKWPTCRDAIVAAINCTYHRNAAVTIIDTNRFQGQVYLSVHPLHH